MELRIKQLQARAMLPRRATTDSTGLDVFACLDAPVMLGRAPQRVATGLALEVPAGYDVQVRPRSGLSLRGVDVALGTIDADYRGELFVTMWTFGETDGYEILHGDRIAQLVVAPAPAVVVVKVQDLTATERADGGHGSTGR